MMKTVPLSFILRRAFVDIGTSMKGSNTVALPLLLPGLVQANVFRMLAAVRLPWLEVKGLSVVVVAPVGTHPLVEAVVTKISRISDTDVLARLLASVPEMQVPTPVAMTAATSGTACVARMVELRPERSACAAADRGHHWMHAHTW